ncbi:MAG: chemotaxis protein CheW [Gemmatimonadaceae bacterium]
MASTQIPTQQQRYQAAAEDTPDGATEDGAGTVRQLLTFAAGGRLYGCDVGVVREILPSRRCTRLPGAPPYVRGLTNLRGTIVTVIDLSAHLGGAATGARAARGSGPATVSGTEGSIILAEIGTKVVGLAVDGVRDVQTVDGSAVEAFGGAGAAAADGPAVAAGVVAGLGQLGGEMVIVLDVQTILRQVLA